MAILAVNAGSSSLKFSLYPLLEGQVQPHLMSGEIEGLEPFGVPTLSWSFQGQNKTQQLEPAIGEPFDQALKKLAELLATEPNLPTLEAIAHRVVHGGKDESESVRVTEEILTRLSLLNSLAPLHQPNNLKGIRAFQKAFPALPQVACFDTSFHATQAEVAYSFALPQSLTDQGLRRYGFHGLSYKYIMGAIQQHSQRAGGRVLMAHLGNGTSLCAALGGRSCATTMGFSSLDGLMMGTRCGDLDPGVLLYLLAQGWDHARLETLLYKQSGLLGVSGISADMRHLRSNDSKEAKRAIDLFTNRVVHESGAMVASMDGLDVLTFSGGIGEHDSVLRAQVCDRLAWMGVAIDPELNALAVNKKIQAIHQANSRVEVWVVPTDEGFVAAKEASKLITKATPKSY